MVFNFFRVSLWTCKVLGFPVAFNTNTGLCYASKSSLIYCLLLTFICAISYPFGKPSFTEFSDHDFLMVSPFHQSVAWFQTNYNGCLTIALLLGMIVYRQDIVDIYNIRQQLHTHFTTIYTMVKIKSYSRVYANQLMVLCSLLTIKSILFNLSVVNLSDGPVQLIEYLTKMWPVKFPLLLMTLANNLFLETVAFLIIFITKLHRVIDEELSQRRQLLSANVQSSQLIEEMACNYDAIYQHKSRMTRMISCSVVLLSVQRFVDMVVRMFFIYSVFDAYFTDRATFNYMLAICHVLQLLVTIAESSLISSACERLLEEVGLGEYYIWCPFLNIFCYFKTQKLTELIIACCDRVEEEERLRESAGLFALQLLNQPMTFTVCGMFRLSYQFTSEVIIWPIY